MFNNSLISNIKKIYLFEIFSAMFFAVPVMVLFWKDNGLSLTQIMILQSFFSILIVLLEIPSGYFADLYGRKISLVISALGLFFAILIYSFGYTYFVFFLAEIFFAINISFSSGSLSALMYDTLKDLKIEDKYKKYWGNSRFYGLISFAISGIIGGFIAKYGLRYTIYASLPVFFLVIPISLSFVEPKRHKVIVKKGYLKELFIIIKDIFVKQKKLRWLIIYSAFIFGFNKAGFWTYQPYFKLAGIDIVYFGIIYAVLTFSAAVFSKYAHLFEKKLGAKYSLIILTLFTGLGYLLMGNLIFVFSFTFIFFEQFVRSFRDIVVTDYINKMTDSSIRATVLSAESLVGKLIYASIIPLLGWFADVYSLQQALTILGLTTLIIGATLLLIMKKAELI